MTYGGPGPGYPQQPGPGKQWQQGQQGQQWPQRQQAPWPHGHPQQAYPHQQPAPHPAHPQQPYPSRPYLQHQPPGQEPPLTLPGWGAIPALLGVVLAVLGLFALPWVSDVSFSELNDSIRAAAASATGLDGNDRWIELYVTQGVFIALGVAAVAPATWSLGAIRSRESIRKRGGVTRKSLQEGRTGPTRILISVLTGLCLLYHVVSLFILTDNGEHLDELDAGPWLLVAGTALSVAGAVIGPRIPRAPGWPAR
ncbi:hypothetical protein ACFS2C_04430 [Prauserella oleivorans]|uniref:Uncharacterized protein n=1 Tax=Prauserella oleivorans TaxID=1478153 RepID=A0ABW5W6Y2_9PSEU